MWAGEGRADSLTMQCGTLCISALIQLSLIDINLRVAKLRNVDAECGDYTRRGQGGEVWHKES